MVPLVFSHWNGEPSVTNRLLVHVAVQGRERERGNGMLRCRMIIINHINNKLSIYTGCDP